MKKIVTSGVSSITVVKQIHTGAGALPFSDAIIGKHTLSDMSAAKYTPLVFKQENDTLAQYLEMISGLLAQLKPLNANSVTVNQQFIKQDIIKQIQNNISIAVKTGHPDALRLLRDMTANADFSSNETVERIASEITRIKKNSFLTNNRFSSSIERRERNKVRKILEIAAVPPISVISPMQIQVWRMTERRAAEQKLTEQRMTERERLSSVDHFAERFAYSDSTDRFLQAYRTDRTHKTDRSYSADLASWFFHKATESQTRLHLLTSFLQRQETRKVEKPAQTVISTSRSVTNDSQTVHNTAQAIHYTSYVRRNSMNLAVSNNTAKMIHNTALLFNSPAQTFNNATAYAVNNSKVRAVSNNSVQLTSSNRVQAVSYDSELAVNNYMAQAVNRNALLTVRNMAQVIHKIAEQTICNTAAMVNSLFRSSSVWQRDSFLTDVAIQVGNFSRSVTRNMFNSILRTHSLLRNILQNRTIQSYDLRNHTSQNNYFREVSYNSKQAEFVFHREQLIQHGFWERMPEAQTRSVTLTASANTALRQFWTRQRNTAVHWQTLRFATAQQMAKHTTLGTISRITAAFAVFEGMREILTASAATVKTHPQNRLIVSASGVGMPGRDGHRREITHVYGTKETELRSQGSYAYESVPGQSSRQEYIRTSLTSRISHTVLNRLTAIFRQRQLSVMRANTDVWSLTAVDARKQQITNKVLNRFFSSYTNIEKHEMKLLRQNSSISHTARREQAQLQTSQSYFFNSTNLLFQQNTMPHGTRRTDVLNVVNKANNVSVRNITNTANNVNTAHTAYTAGITNILGTVHTDKTIYASNTSNSVSAVPIVNSSNAVHSAPVASELAAGGALVHRESESEHNSNKETAHLTEAEVIRIIRKESVSFLEKHREDIQSLDVSRKKANAEEREQWIAKLADQVVFKDKNGKINPTSLDVDWLFEEIYQKIERALLSERRRIGR